MVESCSDLNCGIYRILNLRNGKSYIGSAKNIRKRKNVHFSLLKRNIHHSVKLQHGWNKHQSEVFIFEPVMYCNEEMLIKYEQQFLDFYKPEYNMSMIAGRVEMTKDTLARMRCAQQGEKGNKSKLTEKDVLYIRSSHKTLKELALKFGVHFATIGKIRRGVTWTNLPNSKTFNGNTGKKRTSKMRENLSKLYQGEKSLTAKLTEENVRHIRASTETVKDLALKFGVGRTTIYDIRSGHKWKHLI